MRDTVTPIPPCRGAEEEIPDVIFFPNLTSLTRAPQWLYPMGSHKAVNMLSPYGKKAG
jgi:hypothetical protein